MENALTIPGQATIVALILSEGMTFNEWSAVGKTLSWVNKACMWWIGDWLVFGERKYGGMYSQALDELDFEYQTLANAKYVSGRIEFSRRRENLSWSHHLEVAKLPPEKQDRLLDRAERENMTRATMRKTIKAEERQGLIATMPDGKYAVIYADPPWQFSNSGLSQSAEQQYPTMATEEICDLSVMVNGFSTSETVLFMWATNAMLTDALKVMQVWGYKYKTNMVWVKDRASGIGWWVRTRHELLLIGARANTPLPAVMPDSVLNYPTTGKHSQKPLDIYEIIESMFLGKKIEMFCRKSKQGWDAHGNQIE